MGWICKNCGSTKFKIEIDVYVEIDLYQDGDFEYKKDTLNIKNHHCYINCCNCYESELNIEDIAEWVEDATENNLGDESDYI